METTSGPEWKQQWFFSKIHAALTQSVFVAAVTGFLLKINVVLDSLFESGN